jgi:hypothetical protein
MTNLFNSKLSRTQLMDMYIKLYSERYQEDPLINPQAGRSQLVNLIEEMSNPN